MTTQQKLISEWADSELEKAIRTKRSITGGLAEFLKNLYITYPNQFKRAVKLGYITPQEEKDAMS